MAVNFKILNSEKNPRSDGVLMIRMETFFLESFFLQSQCSDPLYFPVIWCFHFHKVMEHYIQATIISRLIFCYFYPSVFFLVKQQFGAECNFPKWHVNMRAWHAAKIYISDLASHSMHFVTIYRHMLVTAVLCSGCHMGGIFSINFFFITFLFTFLLFICTFFVNTFIFSLLATVLFFWFYVRASVYEYVRVWSDFCFCHCTCINLVKTFNP